MTHDSTYYEKNTRRAQRKAFREMLGIKQEAMAFELGEDWTQKRISLLEQKESIDSPILEQVSRILKVPVEAFKNFDEDAAINIIANTITNNDNGAVVNNNPIFHPIDKLVQLHEEKIALYERMLKEKEEMMTKLEKLIEKK